METGGSTKYQDFFCIECKQLLEQPKQLVATFLICFLLLHWASCPLKLSLAVYFFFLKKQQQQTALRPVGIPLAGTHVKKNYSILWYKYYNIHCSVFVDFTVVFTVVYLYLTR